MSEAKEIPTMATAAERAYEHIKRSILQGTLAPGSQIKEEEVAALCGVSRTPVRDALRRLEAEMFIERSESQRSFVCHWSEADIAELFTLRAMLESYAAERAAQNMTPIVLAKLRATCQRIATAIELPQPSIETFLEQNDVFHRLIVETAGSDRLAGMIGRLILRSVVRRTAATYTRTALRRSLAEHEEIVAAFENGDGQWASALMTAHIRRAFHSHAGKDAAVAA